MRLRRIVIALAACIALHLPAVLFAQSEEEDVQPVKETKYSGMFGVGGGVSPFWLFLNTDKLNAALAQKGFPTFSAKGMFLLGGHGYVYIMVIPNLRVGGMGASGSAEVEVIISQGPASDPVEFYNRARISTGFGGVTLEYVIPMRRFQVAIGGLLGAGSYSLSLTTLPNHDRSWSTIRSYPSNSDYQHDFTMSFFAWQPQVSLEYLVSPFSVISLTGGYYGSSSGSWTLNDAFTVTDMPDVRFGGTFVRLGLTFGLFIPD
jgi:hypothetical protein